MSRRAELSLGSALGGERASTASALDRCGIVVTDRRGVIRKVDPSVVAWMEGARERLLGTLFPLCFRESSWSDCRAHLGRLLASSTAQDWEADLRGARGEVVRVAVRAEIAPGQTARPLVNWRLLRIGPVAAARHREEIPAARVEASEAETTMPFGGIAAAAAHQMKAPLAAISGALQLLLRQGDSASVGPQVLDAMLSRVQQVNRLVDQFLVLARVASPRRDEVSVGFLVGKAAELLRESGDLAGVSIVPAIPHETTVRGDADLLVQALANLLRNGAEAMGGNRELRIAAALEGERCRVEVRDRGPGVPSSIADRVFEPFFTTRPRGSGLGLPIVREIVRAHGGSVSLSSAPGRGTCVTLLLPAGTAAGQPRVDVATDADEHGRLAV